VETETNISPPAPSTLARYGLSLEEWQSLLHAQGGVCGVCGTVPSPSKRDGKVRLVTEHEHVRGWKKMPPELRKLYVRGLTCWWCNTSYLGRGITVEKAEGMVRYLTNYANRRPA
jgi:hypothetical protein